MPMCLGLPRWLNGKESTCSAGDVGSIPGSERSPGEELVTNSNILAWEIQWTEEPGGLQSMESQTSWILSILASKQQQQQQQLKVL